MNEPLLFDWSQVFAIQNEALRQSISNKSLPDILNWLTNNLDSLNDEQAVTILLMSNEGLRPTAGARIPEAWVKLIDPLPLGEKKGSCGTAGFFKKTIICENILEDKLWEDFREFQPLHGFMACWSQPVLDMASQLLATFAVYFKSPRSPNESELQLIKSLANTVGIIIERKRYERKLISDRDSAVSTTQAKSEFLANMSHEIRTPMNAIIGMAHLMKTTSLTTVQKDYLNKIDLSAKSLLSIINDLLDLSKIEAGKMNLEQVCFSIEEIMERVLVVISPIAQQKKLEFLIDNEIERGVCLYGDVNRLAQVIINLGINAVKFTSKGKVIITIEELKENNGNFLIRIAVKDSGIGIEPSLLDEMFKPFTQADASVSRKFGGTGLGLNLCSKFVELMGGRIGVESKVGQGSLFWIEVPFDECEDNTDNIIIPESINGLSVLVIDDDPTSAKILERMLVGFGCEVSIVLSGEQALNKLRHSPSESPFQVIIVDWLMIGMDGIQTTRAIMSDDLISPTPQVIMVSAYSNDYLIEQIDGMGINGPLCKPINQYKMLKSIIEVTGVPNDTLINAFGDEEISKNRMQLYGIRILLVEDNPINRQIAREMLISIGITVYEASDGEEAVTFLKNNAVDLVLMDVQMPKIDGHTATKMIRSIKELHDLPIIAMTAHAMNSDIEKSLKSGMNDHISKPFNFNNLVETIEKWINKSNLSLSQVIPDDEMSSDKQFLPEVLPGINVKNGLEFGLGREELYLKSLHLFYSKYSNTKRKIHQAFLNNDLQTVIEISHSLKGSSGLIGATELSQIAGEVESQLRTGAISNNSLLFERFEEELSTVIKGLSFLCDFESS